MYARSELVEQLRLYENAFDNLGLLEGNRYYALTKGDHRFKMLMDGLRALIAKADAEGTRVVEAPRIDV